MDHEDDQSKLSSSSNHSQFFTTESTCFWHELKASQEPSATSQNITLLLNQNSVNIPSWCCKRQYSCMRLSMKSTSLVMVKNKLLIKMWKSLNVRLPLRKYPQRDTFCPLSTPKGCKFLPWRNSSPNKIVITNSKTFKIPFIYRIIIYYYNILYFKICFYFVFSSFISILVLEYFLFLLFNFLIQFCRICKNVSPISRQFVRGG